MKRLLLGLIAGALIALAVGIAHEAWRVQRFYSVKPGMTRSEVLDRVGTPTDRGNGSCLEETACHGDCWLYRQRLFEHLVVTFDTSGRVICRDIYRPEIRLHG